MFYLSLLSSHFWRSFNREYKHFMTCKKWFWRRLVLLNFQAICIELNFPWKNFYDVVILTDVITSSIISQNAHQSLEFKAHKLGFLLNIEFWKKSEQGKTQGRIYLSPLCSAHVWGINFLVHPMVKQLLRFLNISCGKRQ